MAMIPQTGGVITRAEDRPRESCDDPARGTVSWFTLFSRDITATTHMSAGIAEIAAGEGRQPLHRHDQPEIYLILEGTGILTLDGQDTTVTAGSAVFIPGNGEHGLRQGSENCSRLPSRLLVADGWGVRGALGRGEAVHHLRISKPCF